jgi:hypothetical protein
MSNGSMSPTQALPPQAFTTTLILLLAGASLPGMAQESYKLGPGSTVGPATRIKAKCSPPNPDDGSVECDTTLENPPGDTPAKPTYHPFEH